MIIVLPIRLPMVRLKSYRQQYTVCICIYITENVDDYFITLAYWFFYLRVVHSIYHIFFNQLIFNGTLPVRTFIWVPATATLVWMWVRFISVI